MATNSERYCHTRCYLIFDSGTDTHDLQYWTVFPYGSLLLMVQVAAMPALGLSRGDKAIISGVLGLCKTAILLSLETCAKDASQFGSGISLLLLK